MELGLKGKVAIVTGGSDGLGRATAERLCAEGGHVAICGRRAEPLRTVAEGIRRSGGEVLDVPADVTRPADLGHLVNATVERFGRLDILVNNAGTSATGAFETIDDARLQNDLELKLFAATRLARLCLPVMRRSGGGRIVNILNTAAKAPPARSMPTSVSRAAGLAFTKALSKEVAPDGILVNAVCIGLVKSGQWVRRWEAAGRPGTLDDYYAAMAKEHAVPVGRVGDAAELASLVAFLVSDQARYVTGVAINFDGGLAAVV